MTGQIFSNPQKTRRHSGNDIDIVVPDKMDDFFDGRGPGDRKLQRAGRGMIYREGDKKKRSVQLSGIKDVGYPLAFLQAVRGKPLPEEFRKTLPLFSRKYREFRVAGRSAALEDNSVAHPAREQAVVCRRIRIPEVFLVHNRELLKLPSGFGNIPVQLSIEGGIATGRTDHMVE
ncbi:MAG: hypothetical protein ABIJ25_12030 [Pseudomonadota bacterium]